MARIRANLNDLQSGIEAWSRAADTLQRDTASFNGPLVVPLLLGAVDRHVEELQAFARQHLAAMQELRDGIARLLEELTRSDRAIAYAIEASPAGMLIVDRTDTIKLVNAKAEGIFGYTRQELLDQPVDMLVPRGLRSPPPADGSSLHLDPGAWPMGEVRELHGWRKDGVEIPIEIALNPVQTTDGECILASVTDISERREAERERGFLADHLQHLAGRLITSQEVERARIARELHDDTSQELAALSIALSDLKRKLVAPNQDLEPGVSSLQQRAIRMSGSVRRLSHDLHPSVLEHAGLVAALAGYCAELQGQRGLAVTFSAEGTFDSTDPENALCLYRVAQEALRNVVAHAEATHAEVRLRRIGDSADLTIADDGKGFDVVKARRNSEGLGLVSINERVRLVGGSVSFVTELNKGTRVHVGVPINRHAKTDARHRAPRFATSA